MTKRNHVFQLAGMFVLVAALAVSAPCFSQESNANQNKQSEKPGLLILAHGSPSPRWNGAVMELVKKVESQNEKKKTFHAITGAFMEFAKPDTVSGVEKLEAAGCSRIIVVPVFVCPTSHTHFDVPAVLGLYTSPSIRETLKEEKARIAAPKIPITITQTISEGTLLDRYVRDEAKTLSTDPGNEAVLLIAHGDEQHDGLVEPIMKRLLVEACGSSGITAGQWTFCEVGQSYVKNVVPVVKEIAGQKKRVLVIGFYLASSAKSIHQSGLILAGRQQGDTKSEQANPYEGIDVRFSEKGIIEHADTPGWVLECATEALPVSVQ